LLSRLFGSLKEPEPQPADLSEPTQDSPYAKFLHEEAREPAAQVGRRTSSNALVFLPGEESKEALASRNPIRLKDAFLLETVEKVRPCSTVGIFLPRHEALLMRDPHRGKVGRLIHWQGNTHHLPLFGDWTGTGRESLGFFDPERAVFHLCFSEDSKQPDVSFLFGPAGLGWLPLVGDWDGDGRDGIGLYDPASSSFVLRNEFAGGEPELCFMYGPPGLGWIPFAGDWDGDGKDGIGVYDPLSGSFLLRNDLSGGNHDLSFQIPVAGADWVPLIGDWDGDGIDSIGVYDPETRTFYLCTQSSFGQSDTSFRFGPVGVFGVPFSARWMPAACA
jgi:hypothetical protein